jgi:hypothetical protein
MSFLKQADLAVVGLIQVLNLLLAGQIILFDLFSKFLLQFIDFIHKPILNGRNSIGLFQHFNLILHLGFNRNKSGLLLLDLIFKLTSLLHHHLLKLLSLKLGLLSQLIYY